MSLSVRDVIKRAGRMHGCWASGDEPDADEAMDALVSYNSMKRALFGTVIGPRLSPRPGARRGVPGRDRRRVSDPAGQPTRSPRPSIRKSGARFGVVDAGLNFSAQPCTRAGRRPARQRRSGRPVADRQWPERTVLVPRRHRQLGDRGRCGGTGHADRVSGQPDRLPAQHARHGHRRRIRRRPAAGRDRGRPGRPGGVRPRLFARRGRSPFDIPLGLALQGAG